MVRIADGVVPHRHEQRQQRFLCDILREIPIPRTGQSHCKRPRLEEGSELVFCFQIFPCLTRSARIDRLRRRSRISGHGCQLGPIVYLRFLNRLGPVTIRRGRTTSLQPAFRKGGLMTISKVLILLSLAMVVTACGGSGSSPSPSPPPAPAPPPPPTAPVLAMFINPATGISTSDVRDVQEEILQFDTASNSLIWAADGRRFAGYPVNGNFIRDDRFFQVRFGTKDGQRRASFTEAVAQTICDVAVVGNSTLRLSDQRDGAVRSKLIVRRTRLLALALMAPCRSLASSQRRTTLFSAGMARHYRLTRTTRPGPSDCCSRTGHPPHGDVQRVVGLRQLGGRHGLDGFAQAASSPSVQLANKTTAVSMAAYRVLLDLFPTQQPYLDQVLSAQGIDVADASLDPTSPVGIGNLAAAAVLERRHHDGANQLGDLTPSGQPYADYTAYQPFNPVDTLIDPNRWQPLRQANGSPGLPRPALAPGHAGFALTSPSQFRPPPPHAYPHGLYRQQAIEILHLSARLTDTDKAIAWLWADGPASETSRGPCVLLLARERLEYVTGSTLDDDVRMYFALGNAMLDVSIAVWDCKVTFDSVRPVSGHPFPVCGHPRSRMGRARTRDGSNRRRRVAVVHGQRPPFAEHVSGHSTFSSAAAEILRLFTGSDVFGGGATVAAGAVGIEAGVVPATPVLLTWPTFASAAQQAGCSQSAGRQPHFQLADVEGRGPARSSDSCAGLGTRVGLLRRAGFPFADAVDRLA